MQVDNDRCQLMYQLEFKLVVTKRSMLNKHSHGHFSWKQKWILYKYLWELYTHHIKYIISNSFESEEVERESHTHLWKEQVINIWHIYTQSEILHTFYGLRCVVLCCALHIDMNSNPIEWNNTTVEFDTHKCILPYYWSTNDW